MKIIKIIIINISLLNFKVSLYTKHKVPYFASLTVNKPFFPLLEYVPQSGLPIKTCLDPPLVF